MHERHIVFPFVACPTLPHFTASSHKPEDFRIKVIEYKMCSHFLILRRIRQHIITTRTGIHAKYLLLLSDFNRAWGRVAQSV
jgi:hypothetical protein